jgi:hypothetical protein
VQHLLEILQALLVVEHLKRHEIIPEEYFTPLPRCMPRRLGGKFLTARHHIIHSGG